MDTEAGKCQENKYFLERGVLKPFSTKQSENPPKSGLASVLVSGA